LFRLSLSLSFPRQSSLTLTKTNPPLRVCYVCGDQFIENGRKASGIEIANAITKCNQRITGDPNAEVPQGWMRGLDPDAQYTVPSTPVEVRESGRDSQRLYGGNNNPDHRSFRRMLRGADTADAARRGLYSSIAAARQHARDFGVGAAHNMRFAGSALMQSASLSPPWAGVPGSAGAAKRAWQPAPLLKVSPRGKP
jgi:hypothetical protein